MVKSKHIVVLHFGNSEFTYHLASTVPVDELWQWWWNFWNIYCIMSPRLLHIFNPYSAEFLKIY